MLDCDVVDHSTFVNTSKHNKEHNYQVNIPDMDAFTYISSEERPCSPPPTLVRSRSSPSLAIVVNDVKSKLVHIRSPCNETLWRKGMPVVIQWDPLDTSVPEVRIVLLQRSAMSSGAYTIVADHVENNGLFVYMRVPFGLHADNDYFLRIMSMDGKQHVDSECFAIGS